MINQLLSDHSITKGKVSNLISNLSETGGDYSDLYFQYSVSESWLLDDGIVKDGSFHISHGVGVRCVKDDKTGFSYSDDLNINAIENAISFAKGVTDDSKNGVIKPIVQTKYTPKYHSKNPLDSLTSKVKVDLLRQINSIARKDLKVTQVSASLAGSYTEVLIASSDGVYQTDYRPMIRLTVTVIIEHEGRNEQGTRGGGGRYDYSYIIENDSAETYTKEALRLAHVALNAKEAPAGMMPVILGSGWPGVLLHEAIGHGLEGDFNRKGSSVFSNRIGEKVANDICTIVDNGTIENRRGSLTMDDEGTPTQETVLIENGILKQYMFDKLNARLMGVPSTGNARRESYAHIPMPRMTNTYMLNGEDEFDDMISSVEDGVYAKNFDGGQVDITSGKFVFSANEAYLIKNGKIDSPIKGATLIGSGDEVLHQISMVGNDLSLDPGIGTCGKDGQSVPVGVGQPSLKIDMITVGGTQLESQ